MSKSNFLDRILIFKQKEIARQKQEIGESELLEQLKASPPPQSLSQALRTSGGPAIIAELKRASPSAGLIRPDFAVLPLAQEYQAHGAAALSVLTDAQFFQGSLDFIGQIRPYIHLPILRKDFIIDVYQLMAARAAGADAALLIVAALEAAQLRELLAAAQEFQLEALVEVHDAPELETALAAGATLIGINNRDLHTFRVDLGVTERLAPRAPNHVTLVGESGVHSPADARRLLAAGVHALLIGTHFMKQPFPGAALAELRSAIGV